MRAAAVADAEALFGQRPEAAVMVGDVLHVEIDGLTFLYRAEEEPRFVLVPECSDCGSTKLRKFDLEDWVVLGAVVRAQAGASCRTCRFTSLTSPKAAGPWPPPGWTRTAPHPAPPTDQAEPPPTRVRSTQGGRRRWPPWQRHRPRHSGGPTRLP